MCRASHYGMKGCAIPFVVGGPQAPSVQDLRLMRLPLKGLAHVRSTYARKYMALLSAEGAFSFCHDLPIRMGVASLDVSATYDTPSELSAFLL